MTKSKLLEINQASSRKHGGARKGAGRKAGSATKRTREIADRASKEGLTPLEVMLMTMRALVTKAEELADGEGAPNGKKIMSPLELMMGAAAVAKDAAPYMHPRLAAIEVSGPDGGPQEFGVRIEFVGAARKAA